FKHSTQLYPEWPMAKFGQTPKKLANQVAIELLNISPRDPAAIAGNYVGWTVPLNYQSVHDLLKELRVDSYKDFRQVTIAEAVQQHWVWVLNLTIVLIVTLLTSVIAVRHIRIRRKLDAALLQSEQRLASAQRIAHLGNWDWNVKTGELFWSDEIYRIFGREPQSFKPTYEVFLENIHPDDRQNVVTVVEKALRNETPYVVDHRIVMPDGSVRHVYEQGEVVFDEEGEPLHMIGTIYDITTLRHAEEAVHKLSQAIEQSSATVIITDTEGLIEYVNPRFVETTGYSAEEVIGKNPRILKSGYTSPEEYEELWQTITAGGEWRGEFHNKKKNGELYWESTIISPIKAKNGSIINFLAVKDDITDHKRTEAQLIQSSKLATLGEMATGIAHELNQPLNIIHMAVESLLDEAKDGSIPTDTLTAKLDRIESQTDRASAIINHIRMFGRTDTGELEAVDLEKVARDAVGLVSEQLRLSEIGLMVNQPETCRKVMGQQLQLEQVVLNLLTNARDAIKENEGSGKKLKQITIDITDDPKSEEVGLTVQDTGGGVPDEVLNRIFEPFFTTKEVGKGTGLGLSISYGIISEMKGRIEVANVDGGARFTISLPVAQDTSRQVDP
ncbi:MAG: PAS domain-containing protein, partial [Anaerolineales bacterium]|nr:PAS domain-containing protein [Anaerolineales bacterium]